MGRVALLFNSARKGARAAPVSISVGFQAKQQGVQVLRVLFFDGENVTHHPVRRRILAVEVFDDFAIAFDRNPLGDQVFADHVDERRALDIFRMCARSKICWIQIRLAAELHNPLRDAVGMILFLRSVLLELLLHRVRAQTLCHEIVTLVAQDAHDLRRERVVQDLDDGIAIGAITRRHCPFLDVRACPLAERCDIGEMGAGMGRGTGSLGTRIGHGSFPSLFQRLATTRATMAPTAAATRTAFKGSRRTYSSVAPRVRTARSPATSLSELNLTRASASLRVSSARATAAPSL